MSILLEIAEQVTPAHLALARVEPMVGAGPVGANHPGVGSSQQLAGNRATPTRHDVKHGDHRGHDHPQPTRLGLFALPPTGFVDITGWLLLHIGVQFLDWLRQGRTDDLLLIDHTPHRHWNFEAGAQQIDHLALAQAVTARQPKVAPTPSSGSPDSGRTGWSPPLAVTSPG